MLAYVVISKTVTDYYKSNKTAATTTKQTNKALVTMVQEK